MNKSEERRIAAKVKDWDESLRGFNKWWGDFKKWCSGAWKEIKWGMNKIVNFYWFPKAKTPGDKAWHLILWWLATLTILRVLRFI